MPPTTTPAAKQQQRAVADTSERTAWQRVPGQGGGFGGGGGGASTTSKIVSAAPLQPLSVEIIDDHIPTVESDSLAEYASGSGGALIDAQSTQDSIEAAAAESMSAIITDSALRAQGTNCACKVQCICQICTCG